jgi:myosin heavy subunit
MVSMEIINDAELLVNIAIRYRNNLIFTYVGPTLLVVNPFQAVPPLFTPEVKFNYIGQIALKKGTNK